MINYTLLKIVRRLVVIGSPFIGIKFFDTLHTANFFLTYVRFIISSIQTNTQRNSCRDLNESLWLQEFVLPIISRKSAHIVVVKLSAKHISCLKVTMDIPGTHSCYRLNRTQCNIAAGRIKAIQCSHRQSNLRY